MDVLNSINRNLEKQSLMKCTIKSEDDSYQLQVNSIIFCLMIRIQKFSTHDKKYKAKKSVQILLMIS